MRCLLWLYQFLCFLLLFHLHFLATCSSSSTQLCPRDQSLALLQFKHSFSINSSASFCYNYPKTDNWKEGTDCCSWDGVTCNNLTGHVIGLDLSCSGLYGTIPPNSSLFLLPHLKSLNLAFNDFRNSWIPSQFGWFASLTHLNLSSSMFSGQVPSTISHLSRLVSLDLSSYFSWGFDYGQLRLKLETPTLKGIVQNLTEVRELVLDEIDMSSVISSSLMNLSSSLTFLSLMGCELPGNFPSNIFYLPKLQFLFLESNSNLIGYLPKSNWSGPLEVFDVSDTLFSGELPDAIGNLESLTSLDISYTLLSGELPYSIGNLESLRYLALSYTLFSGELPDSFGNLESLMSLDLCRCNFTGSIPDIFRNLRKLSFLELSRNNFGGQLPSSIFNLSQLEVLAVSNNQLVGSIPDIFDNLSKLSILRLSGNNFGGQLPSSVFNLTQLTVLDVSHNQLVGSIPYHISRLPNLSYLDFSDNLLNGTIPSWLFTLPSLEILDLSDYQLTCHVNEFQFKSLSTNSHVNYTLPNLRTVGLSACNMSEFPNFLRGSKNLQYLDLSNNKIIKVPKWMWDVGIHSLITLDLSHNFLTSVQKLPWRNLTRLNLDSNLLQGPVPFLSVLQLRFFSISHNKFFGEISSLICNASSLVILDFSHNNLSGMLPQCIGNFSERLLVLDFQMNNFHGTIRTSFSKGCGLKYLNFDGNQLDGSLPQSLVNCRNLEVLDLGNNNIEDNFPYWLGYLPELQVLVLRYNKFHGYVQGSKANTSFPKLQIFDLSNNDFEGPLPTQYIKNLNAMMDVTQGKSNLEYMGVRNYHSYDYSVTVTLKNFEIELVKIITIFTSLDLSNNKFEGEIPEVIGILNSLKGLNFSQNRLTGDIPPSLGKLTNLEWLDLSSNKLVGEIPGQLADLTFLSFLNVSQNRLVGSIPRGKQFNTFENDSYEGNLGLCGFPLLKTCKNDEPQQPPPSTFQEEEDSQSSNGFGWKVVLMGYGCGMVFGMAMGYLVFRTRKPKWFVMLVEGKQHQKAKSSKRNSGRSDGRRN